MRILVSLLICLSMSLCVNAKVIQNGIVKEYNEKAEKTPLSGVELNIRHSGSTVSDKKGKFSLDFLTLNPGDKVSVRKIEKLGYEIFNKDAIEQWNLNPKTPFVIVMCKSEKFKRIRDNYEKVTSESYKQQFNNEKAEIAKLKKEGKIKEAEYQKRLADLEERYERQLDDINNYVDKFSRIDLSELSKIEQEIIELVQQGKIDDALAKYEEQNNLEKYIEEVQTGNEIEDAINKLNDAKKNTEQNREKYLALIRREIDILNLKGGQESIRKIGEKYEKILEVDKSNLDIVLDYILFLNDYNSYEKAIEVFEGVSLYLDNDLVLKERVLTSIGNSFLQLQQIKEAIDFYQQAISTLDSSNIYDEEYRRYRKESLLNNIGLSYLRMRDFQNAAHFFEECMQMCNNYDENSFLKIKCIVNYAIVYRDNKKYDKADELLSEGLACLSKIDIADDSQKEELLYSQALLTKEKGNVASAKGDYDTARLYYQSAVQGIDSLYEKNAQKYGIDFAIINYNIGRTYYTENESSREAIPYYKKAINLYESVLQKYLIQKIIDNYAEVIAQKGRVYSSNNDIKECIKLCNRIDKILSLFEEFPFKGANLLESAATIYADLKIYDKAIEYHEKALKAMEIMYSEYPKIYNMDLARIYTNLAMCYCKSDMLSWGKDCFEKSITIWNDIYAENNAEQEGYMGALFRGFAFLSDTSEYETGLNYLRKMQELDPQNQKLFVFECVILYDHGHHNEAKNAFLKLLERFPEYPKDSEIYKELGPQ